MQFLVFQNFNPAPTGLFLHFICINGGGGQIYPPIWKPIGKW